MSSSISDSILLKLSDRITQMYGFNITSTRWKDLERVLTRMAEEESLTAEALALAILDEKIQSNKLDYLISFLTIGETYFLRHSDQFSAVEELNLKKTIETRRLQGKKHLTLWSVACSTGEEAYSLGIMVLNLIPDIQSWDVHILGTDVNEKSLDIARKGEYGSWSFRGVDSAIKDKFFTSLPDEKFLVADTIRNLVHFSFVNLKSNSWNLPRRFIKNVDVIFCRNVLIYFSRLTAQKVVEKISRHLSESGCLVVAPSEISYVKSELLQPIRHAAGTTIFSIRENRTSIQTVKRSVLTSTSRRKPEKSVVSTQQRKRQSILNASSPTDANTGHTQRYLTALVALESGKIEEAYKALIGTLFLKPDFIPAIITLGNVSRQEGHKEEAVRHFRTAERLLHSMDPGSIVPGSEGISAKGLLEMVRTLLQSAEK